MCDILENLRKTFFIGKKSDFKFQNRGYFREKKIENPIGRRHFFESTSEAKCLEKPLANECGRRVYLTTTPLLYQAQAKRVVIFGKIIKIHQKYGI